MARPRKDKPKYKPEYPEQARRLCLLTKARDEDLAAFFEVGKGTIIDWKRRKPQFREAVEAGKTVADTEVAHSLHRLALGWEGEEQVPIKLKEVKYDPNTGKKISETERVEIVKVFRRYPANPASCIFWLSNRQSSHWRQRPGSDDDSANDNTMVLRRVILEEIKPAALPAPAKAP